MTRHTIIAALILSGTAYAAPATDEQCSAATDLAAHTMQLRRSGITEDAVLDVLRQQEVYSGLPVWAVKQAYDAPLDAPTWMFRGHVFGACKGREQ